MEKVLEILVEIKPNVDYQNEEKLVDDRILDSFSILTLVSELEDAFDIEIPFNEIKPQNLNTLVGIQRMVERLQEGE